MKKALPLRWMCEEGAPLEMDARTQQHMENETLNSTQELSANCQGAAVGAQAVISFANGYSFKKESAEEAKKRISVTA